MSDATKIIQSFESMLAKGQGNAYLQQADFPNALIHLAQCVALNPKYSVQFFLVPTLWRGNADCVAPAARVLDNISNTAGD
ncbi:hypothetical protein [Beggiatoa leptomitoformis]|uniref:Tetratricopeptide repeat protein n=1 Tax=Beggiatoa leptomitoformis TaxID=288004 RepID=A0A2N9YCX9_9GAMM|nr:hypothetical protein [Beggiatoa leptomitoformis]ALG69231.1 hypothetical protein AL038_18015 [Beggiatoa leptomitoformis]AUI68332.1 hypothetical protein BLE401_06200 [Beggiatoa leptomitoformis]